MANLAAGAIQPEAQMELLRRRAGLGASSASLGADRANSLSLQNPIAQGGGVPPERQPEASGALGQPSDMATQRLGQDKGEARTIVNALIQRLRTIGKPGVVPQII